MYSSNRAKFLKDKIKTKLMEYEKDIGIDNLSKILEEIDLIQDYEVLKQMADVELQIELMEYLRKNINKPLEELGTSLSELKIKYNEKYKEVKPVIPYDINVKSENEADFDGVDFDRAEEEEYIEEYSEDVSPEMMALMVRHQMKISANEEYFEEEEDYEEEDFEFDGEDYENEEYSLDEFEEEEEFEEEDLEDSEEDFEFDDENDSENDEDEFEFEEDNSEDEDFEFEEDNLEDEDEDDWENEEDLENDGEYSFEDEEDDEEYDFEDDENEEDFEFEDGEEDEDDEEYQFEPEPDDDFEFEDEDLNQDWNDGIEPSTDWKGFIDAGSNIPLEKICKAAEDTNENKEEDGKKEGEIFKDKDTDDIFKKIHRITVGTKHNLDKITYKARESIEKSDMFDLNSEES